MFSRSALYPLVALLVLGCAVETDPVRQSVEPFPVLCSLPPAEYIDATDNQSRRILTFHAGSEVSTGEELVEINISAPDDAVITGGTIWIYGAHNGQIRLDLARTDAAMSTFLSWLDCESDYGRIHRGLSILVSVPRGEPIQLFARVLTAEHVLLSTGTLNSASMCAPSALRVTASGRNTVLPARPDPRIDASLCVIELVP